MAKKRVKSVDALKKLLAMATDERIAAVAEDVRTKTDQYSQVDPFRLADALGVPDAESPGDDWAFTTYAEIEPLEKCASDYSSELSALVELIADKVVSVL